MLVLFYGCEGEAMSVSVTSGDGVWAVLTHDPSL